MRFSAEHPTNIDAILPEAKQLCFQLIRAGLSVSVATQICRAFLLTGAVSLLQLLAAPPTRADDRAEAEVSVMLPLILELANQRMTIQVHLADQAVVNYPVGSIQVRSNSPTGYQIWLRSHNGGYLTLTQADQTYRVPYQLHYNNTPSVSALQNSPVLVESTHASSPNLLECATTTGCMRSLAVSIAQLAAATQPTGVYTDTLVFEIRQP